MSGDAIMPNWCQPVKTRCGATGRYVGKVKGRHLVLFVSASDNDLSYDDWNPDENPWAGSPLPTRDECNAFVLGARMPAAVSS